MQEEITPRTASGQEIENSKDGPNGPKGYFLRHVNDERNWVNVYSQTHDHTRTMAGIPAKEFYFNAAPFVDAQLAVQSYYGLDIITMSDDIYNFEAEALGAKMIYGDDCLPSVDFRDPLIKKPSDLLHLKTPNFFEDGRMPFKMQVLSQARALGINKLTFCAPFSLAVMLRGYPFLIRRYEEGPDICKGSDDICG